MSAAKQWDHGRRVGSHGTAQEAPFQGPMRVDFASVEALVRWVLTEGRERMEGSKAIDYGKSAGARRKSSERDVWGMKDAHLRYAFAVGALKDLTPEQRDLLTMAYRGVDDAKPREVVEERQREEGRSAVAGHPGQTNHTPPLSDLKIAERLGVSRRTVTDRRHKALVLVRARAEALGLIDMRDRYRRAS